MAKKTNPENTFWVKEWLDNNATTMLERFGVGHWRVTFEVTVLENNLADCTPMPEYRRAIIRVDPIRIKTVDELIDTVEHEILHIVKSSFDSFYGLIVALNLDPAVMRVLDEAWRQCNENDMVATQCLVASIRENK